MPSTLPLQATLLRLLEPLLATRHARRNLHALLALLLDTTRKKRLRGATGSSKSALSRFLTHAPLDLGSAWQALNLAVLGDVFRRFSNRRGARPLLTLCLDLTVLPKVGP